jgi:hypothetical protein
MCAAGTVYWDPSGMEPLLAFLRRHGFVIAGVGLPLLLVLAFVVARAAARVLVEDPRHALLFSIADGYSSSESERVCDLAVVDGRLVARWNSAQKANYPPPPRLYRFDAASGERIELAVPEAGDLAAAGGRVELPVEGLEGLRLEAGPRAPDGWEFETVYGGRGLFGELFAGGSRGPRSFVHKRGRRIEVPHPASEPYSWNVPVLHGWIVPVEGGR